MAGRTQKEVHFVCPFGDRSGKRGLAPNVGELRTFRARRKSAAERRALLSVQRELRLIDSCSRTKYLKDFREAFRAYERLLLPAEVENFATSCDILLIGDYHALPSSQQFTSRLAIQLKQEGDRPVIVGLEPIFKRDQAILDDWQAGSIADSELRTRLRFDSQWGYAWEPFIQMLHMLRQSRIPMFGLDCYPRGDMRRIGTRDRHAAMMVAELEARYPDSQILVSFGESHLAPQHLPAAVKKRLPDMRVHTILQNLDELYWHAAGESLQPPEGVRISDDVICVFNTTPWEKYQCYRACVENWRSEGANKADYAPVFYDLIDALLEFLRIERYADVDEFEPRYFVDLYPEVYGAKSVGTVRRLLERKKLTPQQIRETLYNLIENGSFYVPERNVLLCFSLRLQSAAECAASFVHHACRRLNEAELPWEESEEGREEGFYRKVVEYGLVDFGSRVLCSVRPLREEQELFGAYSAEREEVEEAMGFSYREYIETVDFLVLHRDFELNQRRYTRRPELMNRFLTARPLKQLDFAAHELGELFGSELYQAYVEGEVSKRFIRSLFFRSLAGAKCARTLYFKAIQRTRTRTSLV
jgi:hypothetical protein